MTYPTEDAYMAGCRALNWRNAELRFHGHEPITLPLDAPHYPPEDFDFSQGHSYHAKTPTPAQAPVPADKASSPGSESCRR